ncbi:MAG: caspase family protein, partial [Methylocystis sp.]
MKRIIFLTLLLTGLFGWLGGEAAFAAEKRIALVIGEAAYKEHPLATAANDAGLIAQTLQAAGFDVTGARDLDEDGLRRALRDFLDKAGASGPETVAFVYFAGLGLQLDGENYLIPVDAAIARDADISLRAARLSDYLKPLAALALKTTVVVIDAARANPFALADQPIAGGLALFEPGPSLLLSYNAAPGTIAPTEAGPYGAYAHGLAETIRAGGMPLMQVFDETRLRVSEMTKGAQIPWNSAPINSSFVFFERTAQAPARPSDDAALRAKPIAQLGARDAYA